jgi:hypothetical protein
MKEKQNKRTVNPIDKDKITDTPHLLPYAHSVGSAIIKPVDKGKIKGLGMAAMFEQTDVHLNQIKEQVELLISQAQEIHDRIQVSEKIYEADCGISPIIGRFYYLYKRKDNNEWLISMISPEEWGEKMPYHYIAGVKLLHDHTWEVIEIASREELYSEVGK